MNERTSKTVERLIQWLVMLGFLTLPYTHFKWMLNLGLTRPVSTIFFALAFGLVCLGGLAANRLNFRAWVAWVASWSNWAILRWWLGLIALGFISAAITPFYGLPKEAFTRLLGYVAIFTTLFAGAYSLPRYGIQRVSRWIVLGYLPILPYAILEIMAIRGVPWAGNWILAFRNAYIVPFTWVFRLALLATEPSFVGFQMVLLALVLPYLTEKWLKWFGWTMVAIGVLFTQSGMVMVLVIVYLGGWLVFSLKTPLLKRLTALAAGSGGLAILAVWFIPPVHQAVDQLAARILAVQRLQLMSVSFMIRFNYIMNLVYAMVDSRGLGLGIGQYGLFWKDIYLRYIDYKQFDRYGEVQRALTTQGDYMKPWSVILGVGVDLGLLGLAVLGGFLVQVYLQLAEPRHRALFFACLIALAGAYPIVTPHIWLALALMAGLGLEAKQARETA